MAMKIECVEWKDHCGTDNTWISLDGTYAPDVMTCATVGWLVSETDETIALASTLVEIKPDAPTKQIANVTTIYKSLITSRRTLSAAKLFVRR